MILIADSGASKTDWACVEREGDRRIFFQSQGYNPNYITQPQIVEDILANLPGGFRVNEVLEIYFYGAGVGQMLTSDEDGLIVFTAAPADYHYQVMNDAEEVEGKVESWTMVEV